LDVDVERALSFLLLLSVVLICVLVLLGISGRVLTEGEVVSRR
jgi:hypothetical protein